MRGYLLTAALPDLQRGIAPLGPPAPTQPELLGRGVGPPTTTPDLRPAVAPPSRCPSPRAWGGGSLLSAARPDLGRGVVPLGRALCAVAATRALLCTLLEQP